MLENTGILRMLAGAAGVTLVLGLGVSVGAVPQFGEETVRTASVSDVIEQHSDVPARQPGDTAPQAQQAPPAATPAPVPTSAPSPATTPTTKAPASTKTPTTKAPTTKTTTAPAPATPTTAAPAPVAVSTKVPRRTPSPAEVQAAITGLKQRVGGLLMLVSPTPDQIAQAGDQICTAFDNGQTFAQVKATGLSMIPASISVTPDTVNWAVRTAVTLYCPGHANKLV